MGKFVSVTSVVNNYQVYIKVEGLIDIEQEKDRLNKEIDRTESYLKSLNKKLSNSNFLKKASEEVVNNEKKKREDMKKKAFDALIGGAPNVPDDVLQAETEYGEENDGN